MFKSSVGQLSKLAVISKRWRVKNLKNEDTFRVHWYGASLRSSES